MISEKMVRMINDQIKAEFESEFLYLSMALWCSRKGYKGALMWLLKQAAEEHEHAMKFIRYLDQVHADVEVPGIDKPNVEFNSLLDVFEKGLEHEKYISSRIFKLMETAEEEKDYFTADFLQWYVTEQLEEETSFSSIVKKLKMVGDSKQGLMMIDAQLGQRQE
ncbi:MULTISPECIES: ferritin [Kosmotoga]|uniref:Ferritin n=1 Tax=Kosmotoga olearia (strain ATCC BAA-1733 / DSM 21960 / TBF 19.5.1) TaxID=521045 RepID=C5CID6_KOSOT|nr:MULTISPECIES: ferritin [Kosmotoga]ACR78870.1 Ferroxidase [Kosmotoga olearia TBF 19.5.1]MDI3524486.1 ferritin [Kosmotoga sp.]MDK2954073.1 ferritin [Kosmotoga sp.]OAA24852.1 ferroxidase [Kosmotoga sp. DU53]